MLTHIKELVRRLATGRRQEIPNAISTVRVLAAVGVMVPLSLILWLGEGTQPALTWWLFGISVAIGVTDWLDGFIARRYGWTSDLGAWLDPLTDKLYVFLAFGCLALLLSWPGDVVVLIVAALTIVREWIITVLRSRVHLPAGFWGKMKTVMQLIGINALFLALTPFGLRADGVFWWIGMVSLGVSVLLAWYSAWGYVRAVHQSK